MMSARSMPWQIGSAVVPLRGRAAGTMARHPTQSDYLSVAKARSCSMLTMPIPWLGTDKYKLYQSVDSTHSGFEPMTLCKGTQPALLPIPPLRLVGGGGGYFF